MKAVNAARGMPLRCAGEDDDARQHGQPPLGAGLHEEEAEHGAERDVAHGDGRRQRQHGEAIRIAFGNCEILMIHEEIWRAGQQDILANPGAIG